MRSGLFFAFFGAISSALWTVFHHEAASKVNPIVGAIIVSIFAMILGAIIFSFKYQASALVISKKGLLFLALVGVAAFASDYFALRTFASDLPVSIGGPILIGGGVALAATIGVIMGETLTWQIGVGIILVTVGASLIAYIR